MSSPLTVKREIGNNMTLADALVFIFCTPMGWVGIIVIGFAIGLARGTL